MFDRLTENGLRGAQKYKHIYIYIEGKRERERENSQNYQICVRDI